MSKDQTPKGAGEEIPQNFNKDNMAVDFLLAGARKQAKESKKTMREIILKQKAAILRKKQPDKANWLKWINIALKNIPDDEE